MTTVRLCWVSFLTYIFLVGHAFDKANVKQFRTIPNYLREMFKLALWNKTTFRFRNVQKGKCDG